MPFYQKIQFGRRGPDSGVPGMLDRATTRGRATENSCNNASRNTCEPEPRRVTLIQVKPGISTQQARAAGTRSAEGDVDFPSDYNEGETPTLWIDGREAPGTPLTGGCRRNYLLGNSVSATPARPAAVTIAPV
jgi:hypothetical protein